MRVTTSEFVLSVQKSIDSCKFKVSKRLLGPGNTAYISLFKLAKHATEAD
jgi:hypothetical protein